MEEVIAKSVRTLYIITYSILLVMGGIFIAAGAFFTFFDEEIIIVYGWIAIVLGIIIILGSIGYLIYFIRMPKDAVKLKDGKLYFRNGVVCTPTELTDFKSKTMGLDGSLFGFGKIIFSVNGKEYKLRFVDKADATVKRLFMLKAECSVKEHIAKEQEANKNLQEENNG